MAGSEAWLDGSEACLTGFEVCLAGSEACLAGSWALEGGERMNRWMDGWKISPFYRTLSSIGAAAQKEKMKK